MHAEPRSLCGEPAEPRLDDPDLRRVVSYLGCGLALAEGFIVLTGRDRASLLDRLLAIGEPDRLTPLRLSAAQSLAGATAIGLARALGLSAQIDDPGLLEHLEAKLEADLRVGKRNLLVVEDAQLLSTAAFDELLDLSAMRAGGRALIQILLLGAAELRQRLESPALEPLRKRIIASHHFEGEESREEARVLPLRAGSIGARGITPADARLEQRMAALEARAEEQEVTIRRILNLLVDWSERR